MLITNFRLKYVLYQVVLAGYQLLDTGRMHPVRERARRALESTVDYVETNLPDALGFDTQKEVLAYAMGEVRVPGHYLEFGVFTGGTMRYHMRAPDGTVFPNEGRFEEVVLHERIIVVGTVEIAGNVAFTARTEARFSEANGRTTIAIRRNASANCPAG